MLLWISASVSVLFELELIDDVIFGQKIDIAGIPPSKKYVAFKLLSITVLVCVN